MTEVALIVVALANLYLLVRFIKWVRRDLPGELDQTTAMKLRAESPPLSADREEGSEKTSAEHKDRRVGPDLPKADEKVSQGEISIETLQEAIRRDTGQR
jgi:hypothetical protein